MDGGSGSPYEDTMHCEPNVCRCWCRVGFSPAHTVWLHTVWLPMASAGHQRYGGGRGGRAMLTESFQVESADTTPELVHEVLVELIALCPLRAHTHTHTYT